MAYNYQNTGFKKRAMSIVKVDTSGVLLHSSRPPGQPDSCKTLYFPVRISLQFQCRGKVIIFPSCKNDNHDTKTIRR